MSHRILFPARPGSDRLHIAAPDGLSFCGRTLLTSLDASDTGTVCAVCRRGAGRRGIRTRRRYSPDYEGIGIELFRMIRQAGGSK